MIYPFDPNRKKIHLLDVYTVANRTGLPYAAALAVVKVHGIKIGRRYYITEECLIRAVNGKCEQEREESENRWA